MQRIFALALAALVLPGGALADKAADCAATTGIVADAVNERSGGNTQQGAIDVLTSDEGGIEEKYAPAVPMLVEWVYTLPEDQLNDAVAESFSEACLAHD
ncbi:DNA primase [Roseovarius spongiae]|uniref:DNA primase n=1 Tax=Roseovarius spongiae TaxID=2320272 RepID=A0A3A8AW28_9RHOB|nr:DNA primase [Roseovarius spongiae]RKF16538.1 DNA primase [Roseovarius spongiae]